ncbi:MAG: hypothetical protein ABR911_02075 [Syntrophales bacterium]
MAKSLNKSWNSDGVDSYRQFFVDTHGHIFYSRPPKTDEMVFFGGARGGGFKIPRAERCNVIYLSGR